MPWVGGLLNTDGPLGGGTGGSGGTVPGSSTSFSRFATITRTADTNVYLANDIVGAATGSTAAIYFGSLEQVQGGEIMITATSLEIDATSVISGETSYLLHLYSIAPPSALGDNTAWDLPAGDRDYYLGYLDLGTPVDLGSTLYVQTQNVNFQCYLPNPALYGYLVTVGTYTPTSGRVYKPRIHGIKV